MGPVESLTSGKPSVNAIATGEFDVLLCTDLTRLTRLLSPEIMTALGDAGVRVVTADGGEVQVAELLAQAVMNQSAIKRGIQAARERRNAAAEVAGAGSGSE